MNALNKITRIRLEAAARLAASRARVEMQCRGIEKLATEQLRFTGRNITMNLRKIKFR